MVVVHAHTGAVWSHTKVCTAGIKGRDREGCVILPFAVEALSIEAFANLGRVPTLRRRIIEAVESLVEVVLVRVAAALVQQGDVAPALLTRQCHRALCGDHLLARECVDSACHMAQRARAAPQARQEAVLL